MLSSKKVTNDERVILWKSEGTKTMDVRSILAQI
jgi:hypothetical protein